LKHFLFSKEKGPGDEVGKVKGEGQAERYGIYPVKLLTNNKSLWGSG